MKKKIVAIIPARGRSKGLPRKNIIDLAGKPLIGWSIEAALQSRYIDKTVVSSDDEEILDVSRKFGADIIKRPDSLATDLASSESVIKHALEQIDSENFEYLILLQPTSPLRNEKDIDLAFKEMLAQNATALISVQEIDNKILKAFIIDDKGFLEKISHKDYAFKRRQDLPPVFLSNGAIYIIRVKDFLETGKLYTSKTFYYKMPKSKSVDVDTYDDIVKINQILNKKIQK